MKAMKRMMALILTVIMTMAMAVTAFAAETPKGELTVKVNENNTLKGQTIKLYKLFDLTVNDEGGHAYTVNATYKDTLKTVLGMTQENPTDEEFYNAVAKWGDKSTEVQNFANNFAAAALTGNLTETASSGKITTAETSYKFTGLDYGYYLVYQTGTKQIQSSLVSVDAETGKEVDLKGEAPSITKTADKATVEIGNIVTYTITGTIPDTTGYTEYTYKIHDTLTGGLDFVADAQGTDFGTTKTVSVKIGEGEAVQKVITITGRTMELDLSQWVRDNQESKGETFTVTYYAKVNSNAIVQTKNNATLEYGNKPKETITTTPKEVVTPTYPLDINKTNKPKAGENAQMLAGATFRLYKSETDATANTNAIKVTGSNGSYTVDPTATNIDMVTVENEITESCGYNLHLNGLAAGDYWLVETASPSGYNKLSAPVKVTITQDETVKTNWTVAKDDVDEADKIIDIQNSTGSLLPSTGGLSTMILTVISIVLVLGVAVSFIISRRRRTE